MGNRGSHFYLTLFSAEALTGRSDESDLQSQFAGLAQTLRDNEEKITQELIAAQGKPVDLNGYYLPSVEKASAAMRPSQTFNQALDKLG